MALIICLNCSKKTSRTLLECIHCDQSIESSIIQHDIKIKAQKQLEVEKKKQVQRNKDLKLINKKAQTNGCAYGCIIFLIGIIIIPLIFHSSDLEDYTQIWVMISMTLPLLIWKFQTKFCFDKLLFKIKNKKKENSSKKVISNKQQWFFNNYLLIFAWLFFWPIGLYGSIKRHKFLNSNSVRDSSSKIERNATDKDDVDKYQLDQLEKSKKQKELKIKEKGEDNKLIDNFLDDLK